MHSTKSRIRLLETPYLNFEELTYLNHENELKTWWGVTRNNNIPAVAVAALTAKKDLILVKQYRPMVETFTVELPAGLMDVEGETPIQTGSRELLEETGYIGQNHEILVGGSRGLTASSGLTDERLFLVGVKEAIKVAEPYTNEGTEPILVPLQDAFEWLMYQANEGIEVDYKLFGTIRLLQHLEG